MPVIAKFDDLRVARGAGSRSVLTEAEWRSIAVSLGLAVREFQIVKSIFDGEKEAMIAESLDLSPHTVHTYIERLYRKLRVGSRCELLVRVFGEHLALKSARTRAGRVARRARGTAR